MNWGKKTS